MNIVSHRLKYQWAALLVYICATVQPAYADEATDLVKAAIDYWRDVSSYSVMDMTIHRPKWERTMTLRVWTRGEKESLVRVMAPAKDTGNSTLLVDNKMWTFSPKINRIIKIPSSMMYQSWMGSDFSNKEVSRSDDIVDQYTHTILETRQDDGHTVYLIESIPLEEAAIVWGREVLAIRDDWIMLEQLFYDQDDVLVQKLQTLEIGELGGRTSALRQRMGKVDAEDEWTELAVSSMQYDVDLDERIFSVANLKNPRE